MPNHIHGIVWLVGAPLAGVLGRGGGRSNVHKMAPLSKTRRPGQGRALPLRLVRWLARISLALLLRGSRG
jgi:hypothetical protein